MKTGQFNFPMIGHVSRVNNMQASKNGINMYSAANDCTVRMWDILNGICDTVFKFADPISCVKMNEDLNLMITASWDKMIRIIDIDKRSIIKSFIGSQQAIKVIVLHGDTVFVAGCDPIIRAYNIRTGDRSQFMGH